MSLKDQMVADADLFVNDEEFGEEVTYHTDGVEPFSCKVDFMQGAVRVGNQMVYVEDQARALIPVASVAAIQAGDYLVRADGMKWDINNDSVTGSDGVFWNVSLTRGRIPTWRRG